MARAVASRKRNERAAVLSDMVISGSFLPAGTSHSLSEVGVRDDGFSAQDGILRQSCDVLCAHHDSALRVHCESAHGPRHRAGEAQLTCGIQKEQHAFADAVALAAAPKASPLVDGQALTRRG